MKDKKKYTCGLLEILNDLQDIKLRRENKGFWCFVPRSKIVFVLPFYLRRRVCVPRMSLCRTSLRGDPCYIVNAGFVTTNTTT